MQLQHVAGLEHGGQHCKSRQPALHSIGGSWFESKRDAFAFERCRSKRVVSVKDVVTGVEERNELASGSVPSGPAETKTFEVKVVEPHAHTDDSTTKEMQVESAGPVEGLPCLEHHRWSFIAPQSRRRRWF